MQMQGRCRCSRPRDRIRGRGQHCPVERRSVIGVGNRACKVTTRTGMRTVRSIMMANVTIVTKIWMIIGITMRMRMAKRGR